MAEILRGTQLQDIQKSMDYLEECGINTDKIETLPGGIPDKMSIEQIVNYVRKQTEQGYKTPKRVLEQWADYLSMCQAQNKSLDEELFYKPKNLKQRHDELVTDGQKLDIVKRMNTDPKLRQQEAEKMEEKFSGASAVMKEVKEKYEFAADGYRMIMPESPVEIVRKDMPCIIVPEAPKGTSTGSRTGKHLSDSLEGSRNRISRSIPSSLNREAQFSRTALL